MKGLIQGKIKTLLQKGCLLVLAHYPWKLVLPLYWQSATKRIQIGKQEISDSLNMLPSITKHLRKAKINRGTRLTDEDCNT